MRCARGGDSIGVASRRAQPRVTRGMAHAHFDEHDFSFVSITALPRDPPHYRRAPDMPSPPPPRATSTPISLPRRLSRRYLRAPKRTPRRPIIPVRHDDAAATLLVNRAIRAAAARHCIARPLRELAHIVEFARSDGRPSALALAARHVLAIDPACEVVLWAQIAAATKLHTLKQSCTVIDNAKEVIEHAKAVLNRPIDNESKLARLERALWETAQDLDEEAHWDVRENVLWLLEETRRRRSLLERERLRRAAVKLMARRHGTSASFSHPRRDDRGGAWGPLRKQGEYDHVGIHTSGGGSGLFRRNSTTRDGPEVCATRSTPEVNGSGRMFPRRSYSCRPKHSMQETQDVFTMPVQQHHEYHRERVATPRYTEAKYTEQDLPSHDYYFANEHVEEISIRSDTSHGASSSSRSGFAGRSTTSSSSSNITPSRRSDAEIVYSSPVSDQFSPFTRREVEHVPIILGHSAIPPNADVVMNVCRAWRAVAVRLDVNRIRRTHRLWYGWVDVGVMSSVKLNGLLMQQRRVGLVTRAWRRYVVRREMKLQNDIQRVVHVALFTQDTDMIEDALAAVDGMSNSMLHLKREYRERLVQLQTNRRAALAVAALREKERVQDEERQKREAVAARAQDWLVWWTEYGRLRGNLRMLLATLHRVLPKGSKWRMVQHAVEADAAQIRTLYRRALLQVHPDRLSAKKLSPLEQVLAQLVFVELQDAYRVFAEQEL